MSGSGSAVFLAGEAGTGFAEEVVLVSATMLDCKEDLRLRSLRERRAEIKKPQRRERRKRASSALRQGELDCT